MKSSLILIAAVLLVTPTLTACAHNRITEADVISDNQDDCSACDDGQETNTPTAGRGLGAFPAAVNEQITDTVF